MKKYFKCFFLILLTFVCQVSVSKPNQKSVNVLSWWGYLDDPQVSKIVKEKCNATISVDEYYSNEEFYDRFGENRDQYDIIVFSQIMYGVIGKEIASNNSSMARLSNGYVGFLKKHYEDSHFPKNVAYFTMSIMGFLWNPTNITLTTSDNIIDAFKKAGGSDVVLIDDPMEVNNIMRLAFNKPFDKNLISLDNMNKMTQKTNVYITDDYSKIYSSNHFAFSYLWSGDAFYDMQKQGYKYKFLVNRQSSYICPDLIAQLNDSATTACVAKVLGSKEVLNIVQNTDYYFSPYGDSSKITDEQFKKFYDAFFGMMPNMGWIKPVSLDDFVEMMNTWKAIKLKESNDQN